MANLEFSNKHNMVAYLEKSEGTTVRTRANGEVELIATIDGHVKIVTEASLRRHLKLEDNDGISSLPNSMIFEQLALMGYETDSDKLTFQKGVEVPLFPTMLNAPTTSPSRITSSPFPESSPSPQHTPTSAPSTSQPSTNAEETVQHPMNHLSKVFIYLDVMRGRKIFDIDEDPNISLVQDEGVTWFQDAEIQEKASDDTKLVLEEQEPTELVEDQGSGEKGEKEFTTPVNFQTYVKQRREVNTSSGGVSTASRQVSTADVSTASEIGSTVGIKAKDKGKAVMTKPESEKKTKLKERQERAGLEEAIRLQEQLEEEERQRLARDAEIAQRLHEEINVVAQETSAQAKQSEEREKKIETKPVEEEKVEEDVKPEQIMKEISKKSGGRRRKSLARKMLTVVPDEEATVDPEILHTKYPIIDWESQSLGSNMHIYKIIRADGNTSYYKTFESMLKRFDRQDLVDLHRLLMKRFEDNTPEGYNLMLWGDLKTMFEPNAEHEVWSNQQDWTLISWKLYENYGVYTLLLDGTLISFHMLVEKRYPFTKEMLEKMLNRKLEAEAESTIDFELLKFVKSQNEEQ
ncbi:hypothetical protein Tco_1059724 [Tanacetum coccineum]